MKKRPNILLILTDQQRHDTISAALNRFGCQTPGIDSLVQRGTTFANAFSTNPVCCPSRASIMTGLHPGAAGVPCNVSPPLREDLPTVGRRLQSAGYETVYHGKSHLKGDLRNLGFEVAYENSHDPTTVLEASRFWRNRDWLTNQRPFFHVVGLLNPHDIYFLDPDGSDEATENPWPNRDASDENRPVLNRYAPPRSDWSDERWAYYRRFYRECVERADACIVELLHELTCSGFASNTWVIFSCDHGDLGGEHGRAFKGLCLADASLRVPLVVAPPDKRYLGAANRDGREPHARFEPFVSEALASHIDLLPTILEIAGLPADKKLPGRSLLPFVQGKAESDANHCIFAEVTANGATNPRIYCVRTAEWKYIYASGGEQELYRISRDPWETTNLIDDLDVCTILEDLRSRLQHRHTKRK